LEISASNAGIAVGETPPNALRITDSDTTSTSGQVVGSVEFYSADASGAGVKGYIESVSVSSAPGANMNFGTAGVSANATKAMTIHYLGGLLVGTSTAGSAVEGDIVVGGGVYLGGTVAANKLDDYEEGAYAAALTCGTSGTITLTASQDTLAYTKIGRTVTVQGQIVVTSVSSPSGQLRISLPFTVTNLGDISERSAGAVALNSVAFTGNYVTLTTSTSGVAYATFLQTDSGSSWSALDANLISSSSLLRVGFTFITND
tara:strand:- start:201 stop:980 length:780 start_codon:yes stop_codon:yes gene_type:complete